MDVKYYTTIEGTITMNDVCKLLRASRNLVKDLMDSGRLKVLNIKNEGAKKNVWRFRAEDVKKFIDQV
jgi:phage pi2 protein 07